MSDQRIHSHVHSVIEWGGAAGDIGASQPTAARLLKLSAAGSGRRGWRESPAATIGNLRGDGTIRPGFGTTIDFAFEREKMQRDRRVREETDEDRFRLSLSNRGIPYLTLRLSYEYAERRGTDIDVTRDFGYYSDFSTGAPEFVLPLPFISGTPIRSVSELRQFDLADRNQRIFSLQGNIALAEIGDLSFTGRYDDSDYNAEYGLDFQRGGSANVELAFLPTALFNASAYATFEGKRRRMRSIHSNFAAAPFDFFVPTTVDTFDPTLFNAGELIVPLFGLPATAYPLENEWVVDSELNTWSFGADVEATLLKKWTLDISYSFLRANEQFDLRFASDAVLVPGLTSDDVAPNLPEQKNTDHIFESSLSYRWNGQWATRLFYRYQYSTIDDFTQLALTPRIGHFLSLGRTDDDFSASVFWCDGTLPLSVALRAPQIGAGFAPGCGRRAAIHISAAPHLGGTAFVPRCGMRRSLVALPGLAPSR